MIRKIIYQLTYNPPATLHVLFSLLVFVFAILLTTTTETKTLFVGLFCVSFFLAIYFYLKGY